MDIFLRGDYFYPTPWSHPYLFLMQICGVPDYNETVAVWSFSLSVLMKWILHGTPPNTIYGIHSLALHFCWLNCSKGEILSTSILLPLSELLFKCCLTFTASWDDFQRLPPGWRYICGRGFECSQYWEIKIPAFDIFINVDAKVQLSRASSNSRFPNNDRWVQRRVFSRGCALPLQSAASNVRASLRVLNM